MHRDPLRNLTLHALIIKLYQLQPDYICEALLLFNYSGNRWYWRTHDSLYMTLIINNKLLL